MPDFNPQKTWLYAVGILEWAAEEIWTPFPDAVEGRFDEKLVNFFKYSGVPEEQIIYLQDSEATFEEITSSFPEFVANAGEEDLLIVYFAGHGDWDSETGKHFFVNYDANAENRDNYWSVTSIFDDIENNFNGWQALLLADCCFSGGLIDEAKRRQDSEISYACVSSAYTHNTSTGDWTFTESLYKGLCGDPSVDLDSDGLITLYDFARYTELEMAFIEEQKSMFFTTGDFDQQMVLANVSEDINPIEGKRVEVEYEGDWYKARTLEKSHGQVKVFYIEDKSEDWVTPAQIIPYKPEMFAVGDEVEAFSGEEWIAATVKKHWYGLHLVTYDDYPEWWDEWVGSQYIRARQ